MRLSDGKLVAESPEGGSEFYVNEGTKTHVINMRIILVFYFCAIMRLYQAELDAIIVVFLFNDMLF